MSSRKPAKVDQPPFDNSSYLPVVKLWLRLGQLGVFKGWRIRDEAAATENPSRPPEVWVREGVDCLANYASCELKEDRGIGYLEFSGRNIGPGLLPERIALTNYGSSDEVGLRAVQIVLAFYNVRDSQSPVVYSRDGHVYQAWPVTVPSYTWEEGFGNLGSRLYREPPAGSRVVLVEPPTGQEGHLLKEYTRFVFHGLHRRMEGVLGRARTTLWKDMSKVAPDSEPLHHFPE